MQMFSLVPFFGFWNWNWRFYVVLVLTVIKCSMHQDLNDEDLINWGVRQILCFLKNIRTKYVRREYFSFSKIFSTQSNKCFSLFTVIINNVLDLQVLVFSKSINNHGHDSLISTSLEYNIYEGYLLQKKNDYSQIIVLWQKVSMESKSVYYAQYHALPQPQVTIIQGSLVNRRSFISPVCLRPCAAKRYDRSGYFNRRRGGIIGCLAVLFWCYEPYDYYESEYYYLWTHVYIATRSKHSAKWR